MQDFSTTDLAVLQLRDALQAEEARRALRTIVRLRDDLEHMERQHVETMRANGYSWADVAEALSVTRAAVWQRYARS